MELVKLLPVHQYSVVIFSYSGPSGILGSDGIEEFPIIGFYLYHVTSAGQSSNWTTSGI